MKWNLFLKYLSLVKWWHWWHCSHSKIIYSKLKHITQKVNLIPVICCEQLGSFLHAGKALPPHLFVVTVYFSSYLNSFIYYQRFWTAPSHKHISEQFIDATGLINTATCDSSPLAQVISFFPLMSMKHSSWTLFCYLWKHNSIQFIVINRTKRIF